MGKRKHSPYRDGAVALLLISLLCLLFEVTSALTHGGTISDHGAAALMSLVRVVGGPFTVWFVLSALPEFPGGATGILFLGGTTVFSFAPWAVYALRPCRDTLVAALMVWFLVGFFFGIAVPST